MERMPQEEGLYGALAKYYDQIYHWKDYQKESRTIKRMIQKYKRSKGSSLLDVACGTGKHIQYLRDDFRCVGIDISEQMLEVAKRNVRGVEFVKGNMLDFDLGIRFDVIVCLFSSFGYLRTRSEIRKAILNFARHMKRGGVLIVEPWIRRSEWNDKTVHMQTYESDSLKIARLNFGHAEDDFSVLDERYLIAEKGRGISDYRDRHRMRFFEPDWMLKAMRGAGLDPLFTENSLMPGRGLVIATKPRMKHVVLSRQRDTW